MMTRRSAVRASVEPLRDRAVSLVDGAKDSAEDAVKAAEHRLFDVIEAGAGRATTRLDHAADRVPEVTVRASGRRVSRKRLFLGVLLAGVLLGVWVWRRAHTSGAASDQGADARMTAPPDDEGNFRVVPAEGRWKLRGPGLDDREAEYRTQAMAIDRAKALAHAAGGGQVIVHGLDGNPRETVTV